MKKIASSNEKRILQDKFHKRDDSKIPSIKSDYKVKTRLISIASKV
jgi:hypothetical protein